MKIGILGGSFNPLHQGHIHIADLAIKKLGLNQVWLIPTLQNPLKEDTATPYRKRLEACIKLTRNHPKIKVKDFAKDSLYTYNLVKKIKAKHPNVEFVWIMGADVIDKFHLWKRYKQLIELIEFVVFSRHDYLTKARNSKAFKLYEKYKFGYNDNKKLPKISFFKTRNCDISSSEIRALKQK